MTDQEIEKDIQAKGLTAARITPDMIKALMARVTYFVQVPDDTTSTFAHAYLDGKFFLTSGHSACVCPENFNAEIGRKIARENAVNKIWPLMGYELRSKLAQGNT